MIYLLTPTGGRLQAFKLLVRFVIDQDYRGPMHWIVVDDCEPPTDMPERLPWCLRIQYIQPAWRWREGDNTQSRCLLEGLKHVPDNGILIILEDDDAYLPGHVSSLVKALEEYELVGERVSKYYNVATERYRRIVGSRHASLSSVGVRANGLKFLRTILKNHTTRIDIELWKNFRGPKKLLDTENVIGIKGMPGRAGIGVGHRKTFGDSDRQDMLSTWLGKKRACYYDQFRSDP